MGCFKQNVPRSTKLSGSRTRPIRAKSTLVSWQVGPDVGNVGGEKVDGVAVEVASGAVVVLDAAWVGGAGQDLGVA